MQLDAFKSNPSTNAAGFCIRDEGGRFIYASTCRIMNTTNCMTEILAFRNGFEYFVKNNPIPVVMKTDSLAMKKVLDGEWKIS